jgi:N-acetylglucosamine-1-phosphodiester alpha-N-acetylglucosaminidase
MLSFIIISLCFLKAPALIAPVPTGVQLNDKFTVVDFYHNISLQYSNFSINDTLSSTGTNYKAFIALLPSDADTKFSFELPLEGCGHLNKTSTTARMHNCTYATNGGFFNTQSFGCEGNIISNGKVQQIAGVNRVNFGVSADYMYVVGYLTNETIVNGSFKWTQLISGAGWLVHRGQPNVNESTIIEGLNDHFVNAKAPRTGICAARNGSLIITQASSLIK